MFQQQPPVAPIAIADKGKDKAFLHQTEGAVKIHLQASAGIFAFLFVLTLVLELRFRLAPGFNAVLNAFLIGLIPAFLYYLLRLWRWHLLIERIEAATGVDINKDGKIGGQKTMVFNVTDSQGVTKKHDTKIPPEYYSEFIIVARCALQGTSTAQTRMNKTFSISRGHWNKIMATYVALGALRKKHPGQSNSEYILCEPEERSRAVLQDVVDQKYTEIEGAWARD